MRWKRKGEKKGRGKCSKRQRSQDPTLSGPASRRRTFKMLLKIATSSDACVLPSAKTVTLSRTATMSSSFVSATCVASGLSGGRENVNKISPQNSSRHWTQTGDTMHTGAAP